MERPQIQVTDEDIMQQLRQAATKDETLMLNLELAFARAVNKAQATAMDEMAGVKVVDPPAEEGDGD